MRIIYDRWAPVKNLNSRRIFPSVTEITATLEKFGKDFPGMADFSVVGTSVGGRPIPCLVLTDHAVDDSRKSHVVISGCEHGTEKNAATTILKLAGWLLDTPGGKKILGKEKIALLPVVNADGYDEVSFSNMNGVNLFADFYFDRKPKQPEAAALASVLDEFSPELFVSVHGTWLDERFRMVESTNVAYTSSLCRCYNREFAERANFAAEKAGYSQDRGEEDLQRILVQIPSDPHHSFGAYNRVESTSVTYAYHKYHSLSMSIEVKFDESGFIRLRSMLESGLLRWKGQGYNGFPNSVISAGGHLFLVSYGKNMEERRKNRIGLWENNYRYTLFSAVPERYGIFFGGIASGEKVRTELHEISPDGPCTLNDMTGYLKSFHDIDFAFAKDELDSMKDSDMGYYLEPSAFKKHDTPDSGNELSGALRIRLSGKVRVQELLVNGKVVKEGGYRLYREKNLSWVEIPLSGHSGIMAFILKYETL